jgi:two-component system NarL family sensor kinase
VQCSRLAEAEGDRRGLEFHASAPLRSEDRMLGILNVASAGSETFTPDVLLLLSAVGAQLGTAIERARLSQKAVALAALEERNRIAREIHDTLAQGLTAITLHLEAAQALGPTRPEVAQRKVEQALGLARTSLEEARRSVLNLRAGALEGRTLPEALRVLVQQFGAETGIGVSATIDDGLRTSAARENGLFRIAQEALANVRKHARARRVGVVLERAGDTLRLVVEDDGAGFDPEAVRPTPNGGFGITGMSERAHLIGGRLVIHSSAGAGTRVTIAVPAD